MMVRHEADRASSTTTGAKQIDRPRAAQDRRRKVWRMADGSPTAARRIEPCLQDSIFRRCQADIDTASRVHLGPTRTSLWVWRRLRIEGYMQRRLIGICA